MPNLIGGMPVVYSAAASARIKTDLGLPSEPTRFFFLIGEINQVKLRNAETGALVACGSHAGDHSAGVGQGCRGLRPSTRQPRGPAPSRPVLAQAAGPGALDTGNARHKTSFTSKKAL